MIRRNIKGATCVACGDPVGFNMRALCGDDGCAQQYAKYSRARRLLRVNGINIEDHDIQPCAFMFTRDVSAKQLMVDAGLLTREHKPKPGKTKKTQREMRKERRERLDKEHKENDGKRRRAARKKQSRQRKVPKWIRKPMTRDERDLLTRWAAVGVRVEQEQCHMETIATLVRAGGLTVEQAEQELIAPADKLRAQLAAMWTGENK